jgi:xanthine dehydrogenase YagT iron-sulfur-binding subunit
VLSRRTFIAASAVGGAAAVAGPSLMDTEPAAAADPVAEGFGSRVTVTVNGTRRTVTVDNRTSLLDLSDPVRAAGGRGDHHHRRAQHG